VLEGKKVKEAYSTAVCARSNAHYGRLHAKSTPVLSKTLIKFISNDVATTRGTNHTWLWKTCDFQQKWYKIILYGWIDLNVYSPHGVLPVSVVFQVSLSMPLCLDGTGIQHIVVTLTDKSPAYSMCLISPMPSREKAYSIRQLVESFHAMLGLNHIKYFGLFMFLLKTRNNF